VKTLFFHLLAIAIVSAFTFFGSYILYKIVDALNPLRVTGEQEDIEFDMSQHGEAEANRR